MPTTTRSQVASVAGSRQPANPTLVIRPDETVVNTIEVNSASVDSFDAVPPVYTIDLSLPPEQRYLRVAKDFSLVIQGLTLIFDQVLESARLPKKSFHLLARLLLRKLYGKEHTAELAGIQSVTGLPMHLLVAYNVLLDIFMGCTSGGVLVQEHGTRKSRMMHFRTLDWGMPELTKALVQLEFRNDLDGEVIARTISYAGFVGVLTGVRKGLSLSLNFRPYHNDDGQIWTNCKFYGHLLMVLFGLRPCIAALLRDLILPKTQSPRQPPRYPKRRWSMRKLRESSYVLAEISGEVPLCPTGLLAEIADSFPSIPTTAAYLCFCSGTQTMILEKDRVSAKIICSDTFVTVTNHDAAYEALSTRAQPVHVAHAKQHQLGVAMKEVIEESMDRKGCMVAKWEGHCRRWEERYYGGRMSGRNRDGKSIELGTLKQWLLESPVCNEETHFVTVLDPVEGAFKWVKSFEQGAWPESDAESE